MMSAYFDAIAAVDIPLAKHFPQQEPPISFALNTLFFTNPADNNRVYQPSYQDDAREQMARAHFLDQLHVLLPLGKVNQILDAYKKYAEQVLNNSDVSYYYSVAEFKQMVPIQKNIEIDVWKTKWYAGPKSEAKITIPLRIVAASGGARAEYDTLLKTILKQFTSDDDSRVCVNAIGKQYLLDIAKSNRVCLYALQDYNGNIITYCIFEEYNNDTVHLHATCCKPLYRQNLFSNQIDKTQPVSGGIGQWFIVNMLQKYYRNYQFFELEAADFELIHMYHYRYEMRLDNGYRREDGDKIRTLITSYNEKKAIAKEYKDKRARLEKLKKQVPSNDAEIANLETEMATYKKTHPVYWKKNAKLLETLAGNALYNELVANYQTNNGWRMTGTVSNVTRTLIHGTMHEKQKYSPQAMTNRLLKNIWMDANHMKSK